MEQQKGSVFPVTKVTRRDRVVLTGCAFMFFWLVLVVAILTTWQK